MTDVRTAATTVERDPEKRRVALPSLTSLRFLAAVLVFFTHTSLTFNPLQPKASISFFGGETGTRLAHFFQLSGPIGVSFFFVLSGFVLTWSWKPGERTTAFYRRRVLKIYPNHIVTWALSMLLFAAAVTPVHSSVANLFLVHAFSNQPVTLQSVNFPSWSLCSELLFYALFPLFIAAVRRISERTLWLWATVLVLCVAAVPVLTRFVQGGMVMPGYDGLTANQMWVAYAFPPPRLFEFVLGMILARIVAAGRWPRIGLLPSAVLFAVGYWLGLVVPRVYGFTLTTVIPISMIICAAAAADLRGRGGWLTSRTMIWLGNVSFAFYLVQGVVVFYGRTKFLDARTFGIAPAIGLLFCLFLVNLLAAWLLYSLVENPVMRRWARSRKPARKASPQTPDSMLAG